MTSLPTLQDRLDTVAQARNNGDPRWKEAWDIALEDLHRGNLVVGQPQANATVFEEVIFGPGLLPGLSFSEVKPLFAWLADHGHGPWEHPSIYPSLVALELEDDFLAWCWAQPQAPAMTEGTLKQQLLSDRLESAFQSYPPGHVAHERMWSRLGLEMDQTWADGRTTFGRTMGLFMENMPYHQKDFEWQNDVRLFRRMAKERLEKGEREQAFEALFPATMAMAWAWKQHQETLKFVPGAKPPAVLASWKQMLKDFAPGVGKKRGETLEGWYAFLEWQKTAPSSVVALQVTLNGWTVLAETSPSLDVHATWSRALDHVVSQLETMGLEKLQAGPALVDQEHLLRPSLWATPLSNFKGFEDDVWKTRLPALIGRSTQPPPATNEPPWEWPDSPFWNAVVETWGQAPWMLAKVNERRLDNVLSDTDHHRRRLRL